MPGASAPAPKPSDKKVGRNRGTDTRHDPSRQVANYSPEFHPTVQYAFESVYRPYSGIGRYA